MTETANTAEAKVAAAGEVLARLQERRAAVVQRAESARQSRIETAFDAFAADDAGAVKTLRQARQATAEALMEVEDLDAAIGEARQRLTAAEVEREAEQREGERRQVVIVCRQRLEAAAAVDASWAGLVADVVAWLRLGGELEALKRGRWKDKLDGQDFVGTTSRAALLRYCPRDLLSLLGLDSPFLAASHGPLALNDGARTVADWLSTDEELEAGDDPDGGDAGPPDGGEPVLPPEGDEGDEDETAALAA